MSPSSIMKLALTVNGTRHELDVSASTTLADLLRSHLSLTGTKVGCDVGECGACTVLIGGKTTLACLVLAVEVDGEEVTTIENVSDERLRVLKRAFVAEAGLQCGFCTPGMIMAASRLPPSADATAIREALVGNICRCTGYTKIVKAVESAGREAWEPCEKR